MENQDQQIRELEDRLEALRIKQGLLSSEILNLSKAIRRLRITVSEEENEVDTAPAREELTRHSIYTTASVSSTQEEKPKGKEEITNIRKRAASRISALGEINSSLEDFIGTSLISKIGIVAIVIGVGIGVKYAFDHDLISPPVRIAMGYLCGAVLLFFSYRLRRDYRAFSAVLLSGGIAIMYYTSFAARVYYELYPEGLAFAIMVLLTMYAIAEALLTDQPVIAHFGLVGAYAVPYLLGGDPDQITFLFTYVAIVNAGILAIAFWRYWKTLYYAAFGFTWLIYSSWLVLDYRQTTHYETALLYLVVFFVLFYLIFLAYKLIKREKYQTSDVVMLLLNSFIFYGLGYFILQEHNTGQDQLGLFTLLNALGHLGVSFVVLAFRLGSKDLFYLVAGVGVIFATIAIPVELDGNWVTFLWASEALLLFAIGRMRAAPAFERIAYALFPLAVLSLLQDWGAYNGSDGAFDSIFNVYLMTSLWSAACFGGGMLINTQWQKAHPLTEGRLPRQLLDYGLPIFFLLTLYLGFLLEITYYFDQLRQAADDSDALVRFQQIWMINYSLFYLTILSLANIFRLRSDELGAVNLAFNGLLILVFLLGALPHFSALHDLYAAGRGDAWYVFIRYLSYVLAGGLLWGSYRYTRAPFMEINIDIIFDLVLHLVLLAVAALELHCWMTSLGAANSFQAGLSILGGLYALLLIGLGISGSRRHLRIAAIVLVAITLIKVIFVDLAGLDTPTKTVVLVILGALLLGISFLYNKFREVLFGVDSRESID